MQNSKETITSEKNDLYVLPATPRNIQITLKSCELLNYAFLV